MTHRRSQGKLEMKKARNYAFLNSEVKHRNNNPEDIKERIYNSTPESLFEVVYNQTKHLLNSDLFIPECPRGLIISDDKGEGFFDAKTIMPQRLSFPMLGM